MNKVKVVADEFGNVIRVSQNNPEYGFVRVEQDAIEVSNGWVRRKVRSSIVRASMQTKTANAYWQSHNYLS